MPIVIKDFQWRQTGESIIITVPLKGNYSSADVFTSSNYLKVSLPPYLFEICLWQPICELQSKCVLTDGKAVFQLYKQKSETWPHLEADTSRDEFLELKKRAVEEAHIKADNNREQNALRKSERQRAAVQEQININSQEHNLIDITRKHEKESAMVQLGLSSPQQSDAAQPQGTKRIGISDKMIFKDEDSGTKSISLNINPLPRQTLNIPVSFTKRVFLTPSRESKVAEEQEWLSKQAEARRKTGFVAEDLRPEEQDPVWLCDKAQSFYNVGNYLGAVSVYTHALTLNSRLYELFIGRAMAHLALENFKSALADSSAALDRLTPAVPQNADARALCLRCRGSALASLGYNSEALGELKAAEAINPNCLDIKKELLRLSD